MQSNPSVPGYRLLRTIGHGRRSVAWLAHDLARRAEVVVKLAPASARGPQQEGAIAARLQGPYLVRVHEYGRAGEWSYVAMEHLESGDLAGRMRRPLGRGEALALLRQAAQALAQLHRQGLVHRDVKPANFLLRGDGSLVLADFGLVVPWGHSDGAGLGTIVGTPRYVAPEQLEGAPASPAADVYSLGVLLYEMLCGRPPFPGETLAEVLAQHLLATPAPLPPELADLQALVDGMLAKDADCRLPDGDAVLGLMGQRFST